MKAFQSILAIILAFSLVSCQTSTLPPQSPVAPSPESSISGPIAEYVQTAPADQGKSDPREVVQSLSPGSRDKPGAKRKQVSIKGASQPTGLLSPPAQDVTAPSLYSPRKNDRK